MTAEGHRVKRFLPLFATALVLWTAAGAMAGTYVFVDGGGVFHFTETPTHAGYRPFFGASLAREIARSPQRYAGLIARMAQENAVDPALVRAMIQAESGFNPWAVSRKGARGLMQLMPETATLHAVHDAFNPAENILGGVRHLRWLLDRFHDNLTLTLAAYNAGENAVLRYGGVPPFRETRTYITRVFSLYGRRPPRFTARQEFAPGGFNPSPLPVPLDTPGVYRVVEADGTPRYTNIPPVNRPQASVR